MRQRGNARLLRVLILCVAASCVLHPGAARAQRALDLQAGVWSVDDSDSNPTLLSAGYWRNLIGPLAFNLKGFAVIAGGPGGSLFGLEPELSLFRGGSRRLVPYGVGGVGVALRSEGSEFVAVWNAGVGVEWNLQPWFGLAVEASSFAEDEAFRGFWNLKDEDRRGWVLSARLSVRWGAGSGRGGSGTAPPPSSPIPATLPAPAPSSGEPAEPLGTDGYALAQQIVATAIGAMGEPYRWGGTSTGAGFDCSGLIWYAYRNHGVSLPRVSRDQARSGRHVPRDVTMLQPGDILLFAERGATVSHVGLYVGDARYIHSTTSGGVRISSLSPYDDAFDDWWFGRWVGARRVLR
ncbi:MAG: C40 family peptidase [Gemmatimonadota bacterium]|nr:MAG: C40 family peptidase [Gemmatimonadota bacterium]